MSEVTIIHERSEPMAQEREEFNNRLIEKFGIDTLSGLPMWRVSWAPSQFAKQLGTFEDYSESGIYLRTVTEVREVPKYDYLGELYILEMLQVIPASNHKDLPTGNLSYECMHPYMHKVNKTYLPLNWEFTEWVCDCYYAGMGQKSLHRYVSNEGGNSLVEKRKRIQRITEYLYSDETKVSDALAYGTGVVVPHKSFGES